MIANIDFVIEDGALKRYKGVDSNIVIPDGVKSIGERAFEGCHSLINVTVSNSVTKIGNCAFEGCDGLTSISIPHGVKSIGRYAFCHCEKLANLTISDSVTSMGAMAFFCCNGLENISVSENNPVFHADGNCLIETKAKCLIVGCMNSVIPTNGSVKSIAEKAFYGCSGLTCISVPKNVTNIGDFAFADCVNLEKVRCADTLKTVGRDVFQGCCKLHTLLIRPALVKEKETGLTAYASWLNNPDILALSAYKDEIFAGALQRRTRLLPVIIQNDMVQALYVLADNKKITKQNIEEEYLKPAIEAGAKQCTAYLMDWKSQNVNPDYEMKRAERELTKDPLNSTDMKKLWTWKKLDDGTIRLNQYKGSDSSVTIPSRIGKTPVSSFGRVFTYVQDSITDVEISFGIKRIEDDAFNNCQKLKNVIIPNTVTSIGNHTFERCYCLTDVMLPDSVTSIGYSAFEDCRGIENITIPNSVVRIDRCAFRGCRLTDIAIPDSVTSIGEYAFDARYGLDSISVSKNNPVFHSEGNCLIETRSKCLIKGCRNSVIPTNGSVTSIKDYAFDDCYGLKSIVIPDSITSIGEYAFRNCHSLENITLPAQLTRIGIEYFNGCERRKNICVSESNPVFHTETNCLIEKETKRLIIGCADSVVPSDGSVTSIGDWAFNDCIGLDNIVIPDSVTHVGNGAFRNCRNLNSITLSKNLESIGDRAFSECSKLKNIVVPKNVKVIGDNAFSKCYGLESITLPGPLKKSYINAFLDEYGSWSCEQLRTVIITGSPSSTDIRFHEGVEIIYTEKSQKTLSNDVFSSKIELGQAMLDFFYPENFDAGKVLVKLIPSCPEIAVFKEYSSYPGSSYHYKYSRYNEQRQRFEQCTFKRLSGSVPEHDALSILYQMSSVINECKEELRSEYTVFQKRYLYDNEMENNDIMGGCCAVKLRGPCNELALARQTIFENAASIILLEKIICTNRGELPCEVRFEFNRDIDITTILKPIIAEIKNTRVLFVNDPPETVDPRIILYKETGKNTFHRKSFYHGRTWSDFYSELSCRANISGKMLSYFGNMDWELNNHIIHRNSCPVWPEDIATDQGQTDSGNWTSINLFSSDPAVETMDKKTPHIDFSGKRFAFTVYNNSSKKRQIAEIESRGGIVRDSVTDKTDYLIVDISYKSTGFMRATELNEKGSHITILSQGYLSKYMRYHSADSDCYYVGNEDMVVKEERPAEEGPKLYVRVRFEDNKSYLYFCSYRIKYGDKVFVDGKKAGEPGTVIEILNALPTGRAAQYTLEVVKAINITAEEKDCETTIT